MSSDSSDVQKYNRKKPNDNYSQKQDKESVVENEVKKLFKENKSNISQAAMYRLKEKYGDENLLDQIQETFLEKQRLIRKRAKKFAKLILEKYGNQNYPLHILLKKAYRYKKKYNLSDAEFEEFRRIYEQQISGMPDKSQRLQVSVPFTSMSRTLGSGSIDMLEGIKVNEDDYRYLQQIMTLYSEKKMTHAQVVLQHITYRSGGMPYEAVSGDFKHDKHNPHCHVHPVLAALFLPKIQILDEHMLVANLAYIVKSRYEKVPIQTKPDYEVFYDLISDPNDVVCSAASPVQDLFNRCMLQTKLWDSVLALRNGRYYDCSNMDFLVAVDNCKINSYDAPDLMYLGDEGTILRRLLGAFSLRPTIVSTTPLYGVVGNNFSAQNAVVPKVNSMPLVTLRLPISTPNDEASIELEQSLNQAQWFLEDNNIVPKNQSIIYSKGVLMFYVPRRSSTLNVAKWTEPYNFNRLPATIAGFERLNDRPVTYRNPMIIKGDEYRLRSVVVVEVNANASDYITGSSTILISQPNDDNQFDTRYFHYNPRGAVVGHKNPDHVIGQTAEPEYKRDAPVTLLNDGNIMTPFGTRESFIEKATSRGTVFVYEQIGSSDPNNLILPFNS